MALCHDFDETPQRVQHIHQRLTLRRLREKYHEIDWIALAHGHSYFGFALEPAYAGTMAGTRIDDDDWWFFEVDAVIPAGIADFGYS
jgi:hypothetical protein